MNFVKLKSSNLALFLGVLLLVFTATNASSRVGYRTVEVPGTSTSYEKAINRALVSAVTQVNGASLASRTRRSLTSGGVAGGGKETFQATSTYSEAISKKTKGIVRSYEILSQGRDKNFPDVYRVRLSVTVATFELSSQLQRLRMAVVPFRFTRKLRRNSGAKSFEETFRRGIENYLTQSRRFAILDRSFDQEQDKELAFVKGPGVRTEELARLGNKVGTDYIVTGIVENVYDSVRKTRMRTTGQVIETREIGGRVAYRIIDVATAQVKFSGTGKIYRESGTLETLADQLASKVGQKIVNAIFPVYVLSVGADGNSVTLGQGGDTITDVGIYNLVQLGSALRDPHTGENLGRSESIVGSVRITDTQARLSTGQILKLRVRKSALLTSDFIVRPRKGLSGAKRGSRAIKKIEKEIKDDFDKEDKEEKDKW